jgi:alkylhydroperoxidase family enzyme
VSSKEGVAVEKVLEIPNYKTSPLFNEREKVALEYADRITITELDVNDQFFAQVQQHFSEDEIVELTATIAWENCSSKFNRALRVNSQQLWECGEQKDVKRD